MRSPILGALRIAIFLFLTTFATALHAIPWIERHDLTGAQFQAEFNIWTAAPYRMRLTRISATEVAGQARYTAIFEKNSETTGWSARHGMTGADFTSIHNDLHSQGFRIVWFDGFGVGNTAYYNAIWEKTSGPAQRLRLGEALSAHQSANTANTVAGFSLLDVSAFSVNGTPLHAGLWVQGGAKSTVRYSLTSASYQTEFNTLSAAGYQIWRVSGFESGGAERFTGVWRTTGLGEGWTFHGMRAADFESHNINARSQGYRTVYAEPYSVGDATFYNAAWIRNGGLGTSRLNAIATAVQNYMSQRNLPGLSLAIAHEGHLVYARGFGFADTSAGTVAHSEHRWRIASTSKTICAVSALRALEDSAAWSLDSKAFGSGALFGTDYGSQAYSTSEKAITLRQLMNMTSGWTSQGKLWYGDEPSYGTDHAKIIGYQLDSVSLANTPGTADCYNNFNYQVVARIPEKISGLSFANYTKAQVFDRCGITSMSLGGRTAADRQFAEVAYYPGDQWGSPETIWPARMDGSTGWVTKPSDLLLLGRRIDGNPRHRDIIGAYALSQMQLGNNKPSCNGGTSSYGLGWYPSSRNGMTWWQHNGAMAGTQAILVVSDDGSLAFAYACNSVHSSDWPSGGFRNTILDLMKTIDDANAWPDIDLFGKYNPGYDSWAADAFGNAVVSHAGLIDFWAPDADPDGDGRNNALENYLGSDPLVANNTPWYKLLPGPGDVTLRWTRRNGNRGVEAAVENSPTLAPWTSTAGAIVDRSDLLTPVGFTTQDARVVLPRGGGNRYIRLTFTVP